MAIKNKTWGGQVNVPYYTDYTYYYPNGSVYQSRMPATGFSSDTGQFASWKGYKYRTWQTTTNWRSLRKSQGYLATLPMSETQADWVQPAPTVNCMNWSLRERKIVHGYAVYVPTASNMLFPGSSISDLRRRAKYKALDNARDMKLNVPVFFGEGRQTVQMIKGIALTLGKAYRQFRRGQFSRAAKTLGIDKPTGTSASNWLAYTYGWSPLISDAKGLAELAAQQVALNGRPKRFTARGSAAMQEDFVYLVPGNAGTVLAGDTRAQGVRTAQAKAGLLCQVVHTESNLAAQVGLGLWDPLLTAWELTPFSFVFDWFVDVGSFLSALSSLQGVDVLAGYDGYWSQFNGTAAIVNLRNGWTADGLKPVTFRHRYASRENWTGSIPRIKTPLWDGLNAYRLTSTAALLRQQLRDLEPAPYSTHRRGKWEGRLPG